MNKQQIQQYDDEATVAWVEAKQRRTQVWKTESRLILGAFGMLLVLFVAGMATGCSCAGNADFFSATACTNDGPTYEAAPEHDHGKGRKK